MQSSERRITELDGIRGLAALGVVVFHYYRHFEVAPIETLLMVAPLQKLHVLLTDHCFVYIENDWYHLLLNLFMFNESGLQRGFSFNGPSWSISTEFIVNAIFLAVALRNPKRAIALGVVLVLGTITLDAAFDWTNPPRYLEPFNRVFRCFLSFGAGLVLHGIHERNRARRIPTWIVEISFALAIAAMLYFMTRPSKDSSYYVLSLLVFPTIVLMSLRSTIIGAPLRTHPLVHLGHISFSVYLLHFPLELFYRDLTLLTGWPVNFDNPITLLSAATICIAASHATWKYFEMPSRRWVK